MRDQAVNDRSTALPADGNAVDVDYVERSYAALHLALAASRAVSSRGSRHEVRALAREASAQQTTQLVGVTACLREWDRPAMLGPHPESPALRGLEGPALDRAFVEELTAHAHASKTAARVELEGGECRRVRDLAQSSIRTQGLMLAAISRLARSTVAR